MSAIRDSLIRLRDSINNLDSSLVSIEQSLAGQQRGLFDAPSVKPARPTAEGRAIAQKLDHAIRKVEDLLKTG